MKIFFLITTAIFISNFTFSQKVGYYNNTSGINGSTLKTELHNIIKDHTSFSYDRAKYILLKSDADTANLGNVILVYTGRTEDGLLYGTGSNDINREHVWAKSHGDFGTSQPTGTDAHNLKPADASVNISRSNKDFDNCQATGTQHLEATGCYYTADAWEPRDEVKGDIARIIFYMATRYEGENGELDLEVVDFINTYPNASHGKLSTLLQWNLTDLPDEFERNRNKEIFNWQKNRNPFIDKPEFAELIWNNTSTNGLDIDNIYTIPHNPQAGDTIRVYSNITTNTGSITANLLWGTSYTAMINNTALSANFIGIIPPQAENTTIYFKVNADNGSISSSSIPYEIYIPYIYTGSTSSIYDIQGQTATSPYINQTVTTTGIVTANFGNGYYIQDGIGEWNGIFVYDGGRNPTIGDSIVITGTVDEYYDFTEIINVANYYFCSSDNPLPNASVINTNELGESFESVLVKFNSAICTNTNSGYGTWLINDGSGNAKIQNTEIFDYYPTIDESYDIEGIVNYSYDEFKVQIRSFNDVSKTIMRLESATALNSTTVNVLFSKEVETTTAENINNYTIDNSISVISAQKDINQNRIVTLTVSNLSSGVYYLTANNIEDLEGNIITNQSEYFSYSNTKINDTELSDIGIYPNPASTYVQVKGYNAKVITYKIMDVYGRETSNTQAKNSSNEFTINISNLAKGIYFLKIKSNTGSRIDKIIKL